MNFRTLVLQLAFICAISTIYAQKNEQNTSSKAILKSTESIAGKTKYLASPFVTAGDRLYMVGHQDGQFPDLGWHVTGEMGGIWDHPIKLMDGFTASVNINQTQICLNNADEFINYPFANKHIYKSNLKGIQIERFQFVPDHQEAIALEYTFINQDNTPKSIKFEWTGHTDLRPVWLGERTNMIDDNDEARWDNASNSWIAKDKKNNWFVQFGSKIPRIQHHQNKTCEFISAGKGCNASIVFDITIPANGQFVLPLTIAGSYISKELAKKTFLDVQKNALKYLSDKKNRYESIEKNASISIPDKKLEQAFRWVKYNADWLVRTVPAFGSGISAGLPDYPWWFGADSDYTLQGLIATGNKSLVYSSINLLNTISEKENGNGRIIHEVSTNGSVYNPGNLNEIPQFASMVAEVYKWTGDKAFLQKYFPTVKKGMTWILAENDKDKNLLADGFGMMEIHGLNSEMIDVAAYTQKAFEDAAFMAKALNEIELSKSYKTKAEILKKKINSDFWVAESQSYADFIGTKEEALHLIDDAIIRADTLRKPWAVEELKAKKNEVLKLPNNTKKGFVLHHNWVVNTPMETGVADPDKAALALKTASKFTNPFGVFVTGIDRDETAGTDESSFVTNKKIFTYTGAVMTLPTGVLTIGENNYGNPDAALDYLKRMTKTFSYALPGSIYEVSPDYGMVVQAWNLYSYAVPIIKQFFGVQPEAANKTIKIAPQMPSDWNTADLKNLMVGNNSISVSYNKINGATFLKLNQTKADWKLMVSFPKGKFKSWKINDKKIAFQSNNSSDFVVITGVENKVEVE